MEAVLVEIFKPPVILVGLGDVTIDWGIWVIAVEHNPAVDSINLEEGSTSIFKIFIPTQISHREPRSTFNSFRLEGVVVVGAVPVVWVRELGFVSLRTVNDARPVPNSFVALIAFIFNPTVITVGGCDVVILVRGIWIIAVEHNPASDTFSLVVGTTSVFKIFIDGRYYYLCSLFNSFLLEGVVVVGTIPVIWVIGLSLIGFSAVSGGWVKV